MKCQSLFSWKNKKNIITLLSADFSQRVVKDKARISHVAAALLLIVVDVLEYSTKLCYFFVSFII